MGRGIDLAAPPAVRARSQVPARSSPRNNRAPASRPATSPSQARSAGGRHGEQAHRCTPHRVPGQRLPGALPLAQSSLLLASLAPGLRAGSLALVISDPEVGRRGRLRRRLDGAFMRGGLACGPRFGANRAPLPPDPPAGPFAAGIPRRLRHLTSPLRAAADVELDRYLGRWYVIANVPYFAERGKVASYVRVPPPPTGASTTCTSSAKAFDAPSSSGRAWPGCPTRAIRHAGGSA